MGEKGIWVYPSFFPAPFSTPQQRRVQQQKERSEKKGDFSAKKKYFRLNLFFALRRNKAGKNGKTAAGNWGAKGFSYFKKKFYVLYSKWLGLGSTDYEKVRFFLKAKILNGLDASLKKIHLRFCSTMCLMYVSQLQLPLYMIHILYCLQRNN